MSDDVYRSWMALKGFTIRKSEKKELHQFIPSDGGTFTFFIAGDYVYSRITNMYLDMIRSTVYTVNEKGDDYDDGS